MSYKVVLHRTDEGISVNVPALPGCWSEGDTEAEVRPDYGSPRVWLAGGLAASRLAVRYASTLVRPATRF